MASNSEEVGSAAKSSVTGSRWGKGVIANSAGLNPSSRSDVRCIALNIFIRSSDAEVYIGISEGLMKAPRRSYAQKQLV